MSKVKALYHIVFCTKHRQSTIDNQNREQLYRFIWSILQTKDCYLYRISGTPNHIHILINLHPKIALSDLMRTIKSQSSGWLKSNPCFPKFDGWAREYFAATVAYENRHPVIEYIKSQQEHHRVYNFDDEMRKLCEVCDMDFFDDDFV